jgi:2-dehydropantoate 2-reductase
MCVVVPATYLEAGAVSIHIGPVSGLLDVGRYPAGVDDMVTMVTTHLCHATFDSRPEPRIMRWKYAKLLNNLGNALDATCGHAAFMHSDLLSRVRTEAETCFAAAGIDYADRQEERARRATLPPMTAVAGMESPGSSTWQSLARGAGSVETDWLTGEVVLIGQLYGVPTPLNEALRRLANRMVRDGLPAGSLTVDQVEDEAERIVGAAS